MLIREDVWMKLTRRLLLGAAAALTAVSVSGVTVSAQQMGGTVVMMVGSSTRHVNPAVQSGTPAGVPGTQVFASPLKYDENWNPQPYLAKSWEVADDGLSVTLHLVENATFHDGHPITSEDVAFSIATIKANHPFQTMFGPVETVETPDAHTAVIKLSQPHPAIMLALSGPLCPIIPKHIYDDGQDMKTHPRNAENVVGSGPFMVESFTPEQITLVKNPNFFVDGRPYLDRIVMRVVKDPAARILAMENGEADLYPFMGSSQEIKRFESADGIVLTNAGYAGIGPINWLAFNTAKAPLSDKRVRQAIAYATDRDFIIKALHRGVSQQQRGPIIESSPLFNANIPAYDVDLDKANALMDEAGLAADGDGIRAKMTIDYIPGSDEQQKNVAEYLKSQLKKIGIELEVRASPDFPTWAGRVGGHDFDMSMDIVFNWGDPVIGVHRTYLSSNIRQGVIWSNTQSYSNPKVDEILNAAAVEPDTAKRKALYDEFQMIIGDDVPIYFVNSLPYHTTYKSGLMNAPTSIWGAMQSMDDLAWK
jgi:peptide/nickel transport system substrate-binding protein